MSPHSWRDDMVSHRVGAQGQAQIRVHLEPAKAAKRRWFRWVGVCAALVVAFAAGVLASPAIHGGHNVWSTLAARLTDLVGPVQLGITIFLTAVAAAIMVMTRLIWLAGRQVIDGAGSQEEKEQAYKLVASTLLK